MPDHDQWRRISAQEPGIAIYPERAGLPPAPPSVRRPALAVPASHAPADWNLVDAIPATKDEDTPPARTAPPAATAPPPPAPPAPRTPPRWLSTLTAALTAIRQPHRRKEDQDA